MNISNCKCNLAYQNEDPAPAMIPSYIPHMCNAVRENTTEGSGKGSATEEKRYSILTLISLIPHGKIVDNSREETRLSHTQASMGQSKVSHEKYFSYTHKKRTAKKPERF